MALATTTAADPAAGEGPPAEAAGAELRGHVSVRGLSESPEDNVVHTSQGDIRARTVVDATGIRGLNLVGAPEQRMHICVAAQQQRAVVDPQAAKAFFDDYGVAEGEKLTWMLFWRGWLRI